MNRWTRSILLSVGLGLATTVLLAWVGSVGLPEWLERGPLLYAAERRATEATNFSPNQTPAVEVVRLDSALRTRINIWTGVHAKALRDYVPTALPPEELAPPELIGIAIKRADWLGQRRGSETVYWWAGWPWRALGCEFPPSDPARSGRTPIGGWILRSASGKGTSDVVVPYTPLWPGFALDWAASGVAWWLAFATVRAARAWIRRRRGRCAGCGYPRVGLDGTTPCPECGAALRAGTAA